MLWSKLETRTKEQCSSLSTFNKRKNQMFNKVTLGSRFVLGALFLVFGLNGFLQFIPMPAPPADAGAFLGALAKTGYMFPLIKLIEIGVGLMLLSNRFVPLALTLIAPIVVNIVAYHGFLDPAGMVLPIVILGLNVFLAFAYRANYRGVLAIHATPTEGASEQVVATA
jgi:hypothetical protein